MSTLTSDARAAIAHARVTGSVGCTYNDTQALRLYTRTGGIVDTKATNYWLIRYPDGTEQITDGSDL